MRKFLAEILILFVERLVPESSVSNCECAHLGRCYDASHHGVVHEHERPRMVPTEVVGRPQIDHPVHPSIGRMPPPPGDYVDDDEVPGFYL